MAGTVVDGRCSECVKAGMKSTVTPSMTTSTSTLLYCPEGYFDIDGKWVNLPNPNTMTRHWTCSNGHHLVTRNEEQ